MSTISLGLLGSAPGKSPLAGKAPDRGSDGGQVFGRILDVAVKPAASSGDLPTTDAAISARELTSILAGEPLMPEDVSSLGLPGGDGPSPAADAAGTAPPPWSAAVEAGATAAFVAAGSWVGPMQLMPTSGQGASEAPPAADGTDPVTTFPTARRAEIGATAMAATLPAGPWLGAMQALPVARESALASQAAYRSAVTSDPRDAVRPAEDRDAATSGTRASPDPGHPAGSQASMRSLMDALGLAAAPDTASSTSTVGMPAAAAQVRVVSVTASRHLALPQTLSLAEPAAGDTPVAAIGSARAPGDVAARSAASAPPAGPDISGGSASSHRVDSVTATASASPEAIAAKPEAGPTRPSGRAAGVSPDSLMPEPSGAGPDFQAAPNGRLGAIPGADDMASAPPVAILAARPDGLVPTGNESRLSSELPSRRASDGGPQIHAAPVPTPASSPAVDDLLLEAKVAIPVARSDGPLPRGIEIRSTSEQLPRRLSGAREIERTSTIETVTAGTDAPSRPEVAISAIRPDASWPTGGAAESRSRTTDRSGAAAAVDGPVSESPAVVVDPAPTPPRAGDTLAVAKQGSSEQRQLPPRDAGSANDAAATASTAGGVHLADLAPQASTASAPAGQQIANAVRSSLTGHADPTGGLTLRAVQPTSSLQVVLEPAGLGTVAVRLHVSEQTLRVEVAAADPKTRALIEGDKSLIAKGLADAGYEIAEIRVTTGAVPTAGGEPKSDGYSSGNPGASTPDGSSSGGQDRAAGGSQGGRQQQQTAGRGRDTDDQRQAFVRRVDDDAYV